MNKNYTIQSLLAEWGNTQHQTPVNNVELKNKILAGFSASPNQVKHQQKKFTAPWFSLALAGMAALMLFLMPNKPNFGVYESSSSALNNNLQKKDATPLYKAPEIDKSEIPIPSFVPAKKANTDPSVQAAPAPSMSESATAGNSGAPAFQAEFQSRAYDFSISDRAYNSLPDDTSLYRPQSEISITDNREYLKTGFSASALTRSVQKLSNRIQTTIRGFGGRVDSSSSSEKFGYISFVVPADKFAAFSQEIKNLVGEKFYKENIQTQNMLPQKQGIEDDQKNINDSLSELSNQKELLTKNHLTRAASLNSQINSYSKQLADLQKQTPDNLQQLLDIQAGKEWLTGVIKALKARLAQENNNYNAELNSLNSYIQDVQKSLEQVNKQNSDLLDNVATVHGSITINWISMWELINFYIPLYWVSLVLIIGAVAAYFFRRRSRIVIA